MIFSYSYDNGKKKVINHQLLLTSCHKNNTNKSNKKSASNVIFNPRRRIWRGSEQLKSDEIKSKDGHKIANY